MISAKSITINKYLPFVILYFFFNSIFLPHGLLYTAILSPFFLFWVYLKGRQNAILTFILLLSPFIFAHLYIGVNIKEYIISLFLLFTVFIFGLTVHTFLIKYHHLERILKHIILINIILTIIAIAAFFTPFQHIFWFLNDITISVKKFPRLALFTYEASYYSMLLVPLAFFYFLKFLFHKTRNNLLVLLLFILLPLMLSFSLGVLGIMAVAIALLFLKYPSIFLLRKSIIRIIIAFTFLIFASVVFLYIVHPDNVLFIRLSNIINGLDPSAKGRTIEAFKIAYNVADLRSLWFGIGLGQLQIVAEEYIRTYYNYNEVLVPTVRIPNSVAETIAHFGFVGLAVRMVLILFFFFKTKVYSNYYRFLLFSFIFIYQFTGSFMVNIVEYVIWILAFSNVFPQFDVKHKRVPQQ